MTESSNYDGSPPVPPAYGVWRSAGERRYEAKYTYYWTKPPSTFDEIAKGSGWAPGGTECFYSRSHCRLTAIPSSPRSGRRYLI